VLGIGLLRVENTILKSIKKEKTTEQTITNKVTGLYIHDLDYMIIKDGLVKHYVIVFISIKDQVKL
jgi:hypothetical protein